MAALQLNKAQIIKKAKQPSAVRRMAALFLITESDKKTIK